MWIPGYWITKQGTLLTLSEMTTQHLENTLRLLKKTVRKEKSVLAKKVLYDKIMEIEDELIKRI